jgi:hypothetical protein
MMVRYRQVSGGGPPGEGHEVGLEFSPYLKRGGFTWAHLYMENAAYAGPDKVTRITLLSKMGQDQGYSVHSRNVLGSALSAVH